MVITLEMQKCRKRAPRSVEFKEARGSFAILFWLPCATWHRVMTHTHHHDFDRPTLFFATRRQGRYSRSLEAFFFTPAAVDFLSVSRAWGTMHGLHSNANKRRRFQKSSVVDWMMPESEEWIRRKRRPDVDRSTSRRMGAWSIFWTSPALFSAVVSAVFPFLCWWTWGMSSRGVYYGGGRLQPKTPVGAHNVDSSMSIWWVYSQSASQHFFGSVVLQSSFSLSCTYALGEWSVASHRWSRRNSSWILPLE